MNGRIVVYLVLIFLSSAGIFYFLNFFKVIDVIDVEDTSLTSFFESEPVEREAFENQDLFLIKEQENQKLAESINIQRDELDLKEQELRVREDSVNQQLLEISEERKNLELEKQSLEKEKQEQESYENKVASIAEQFINMPPERAVERIVALNDDVLIIDILNKIDEDARDEGVISIVPFFYSLMPEDVAARIIRKSSITF